MTRARPGTGRALVEAAVLVALYLAGELARGLARGDDAAAERHAEAIASLERHLHVFGEAAVQRAAGHVPALSTVLGYAYVSLHLAATVAVLVWVYRRHGHAYPAVRTTFALATALAVVGYALYPTAPPRLAGLGIGDTVSHVTAVDLDSGFVSSLYNPYAAFPSMHVGFAVLIAGTVWRLGARTVWRVAALLYPVAILFVIVATGNHFFVDAVAGGAVAALAAGATLALRAGVRLPVPTEA